MLSIKDLSKVYANGTHALSKVCLEIPQGMFGLLGPNGAGKSTLMRILATLQEPSSGFATLDSLNVFTQKSELKKVLGYLPQEFGFYKKDNAYDLLLHFARLKGIEGQAKRRELVEALLHKVNLREVRHQKLGTFSGGMKQRLGIAMVLLGSPKLIIVDEPTSGLDPDERNRFHNLLSELGENVTVILSTHIVEDVSDLCTKMAIIESGRITLEDSPSNAISKLEGNIWELGIEKSDLEMFQDRFNVISSRLFAGKSIIRIHSSENPENGFTVAEPTLQDVYFLNLKAQGTEQSS